MASAYVKIIVLSFAACSVAVGGALLFGALPGLSDLVLSHWDGASGKWPGYWAASSPWTAWMRRVPVRRTMWWPRPGARFGGLRLPSRVPSSLLPDLGRLGEAI